MINEAFLFPPHEAFLSPPCTSSVGEVIGKIIVPSSAAHSGSRVSSLHVVLLRTAHHLRALEGSANTRQRQSQTQGKCSANARKGGGQSCTAVLSPCDVLAGHADDVRVGHRREEPVHRLQVVALRGRNRVAPAAVSAQLFTQLFTQVFATHTGPDLSIGWVFLDPHSHIFPPIKPTHGYEGACPVRPQPRRTSASQGRLSADGWLTL